MRWFSTLPLLGCALALGCAARGTPAGYAGDDARDFVREHRAAIEAEIAVGSGQTLYDLSIIGGCQDVQALGRQLNKRRDAIFSPAPVSDEEVAERVVRALAELPELRCLNLELGPRREFAAGTRHIGPSRASVRQRGAP